MAVRVRIALDIIRDASGGDIAVAILISVVIGTLLLACTCSLMAQYFRHSKRKLRACSTTPALETN